MGRNTVPEVKPPPPLLRSGRRAGRKSVTLTPPLPQRFPDGSPLPSTLTPKGGRGRADAIAGTPPSGLVGRGQREDWWAGRRWGLRRSLRAWEGLLWTHAAVGRAS